MTDNHANGASWSERRARTKQAIYRRVVDHIKAGTTDMAAAPLENDARVYTDPERFAAEKRELFRKYPLVVGLSRDLPEPGTMLVFEDAGPSIVVLRNEAGELKAFLNRCSHRGAKLVHDCAKRRLISCPFHAWSFDLNGALVAVPGAEGFEGVDRAARGLQSVPCAEWNGLIFVEPRVREGGLDIEGFLGTFAPELAQLELGQAEPIRSGKLEVGANWKFALDTYGEGYHFGTLHASNIGQTHYTNVAVYENFGRHHRINFPEKSAAALADLPPEQWNLGDTMGGVHYLFPNTVIFVGSITPGKEYVQLFRLYPGDTVGEMVTYLHMYAPRGILTEDYRQEITAAFDPIRDVVQNEDYWVADGGWANMAEAEPGFKVVFGRNEVALQNQHRVIAEAIGMPLNMYG